MQNFGVFDAKNQLSALPDLVVQGEDWMIARHGKPVTKLVNPDFRPVWSRSIAAAEALVKISKGLTLGDGVTIKEGAVIAALVVEVSATNACCFEDKRTD